MFEMRWVVRYETDSGGDKFMQRVLQYRTKHDLIVTPMNGSQPYVLKNEEWGKWQDVPTVVEGA